MLLQAPNFSDGGVSHQRAQLNRYLPKPKKRNVHYLVDKDKEDEKKEEAEKEEGEEGEVRVLSVVVVVVAVAAVAVIVEVAL